MVSYPEASVASGARLLTFDSHMEPAVTPPAAAAPVPSESASVPLGLQRAAEGPASAAPPPAAPGPTGDLDELAERLYDRIRFHLKSELRLDRERAGLLTDLGR